MKFDIKDIIAKSDKDISYEEFSELHELWKVITATYFAQVGKQGDLLNYQATLDLHVGDD